MKTNTQIFFLLGLLVAGASIATYRPAVSMQSEMKTPSVLSFVVLPLKDLSRDRDREYFAEGVTEYLTANLSLIRGSFVIAHGSVSSFGSKPIEAKEIAAKLGVRYVLQGWASEEDGRIRIRAELIDANIGQRLWVQDFAGAVGQLTALCIDVVAGIAESFGAGLIDEKKPDPVQPLAEDLMLRAKAALRMPQTPLTTADARQLFDQILQIEPRSAEAMTGLASVQLVEALAGRSPAPLQDLVRTKQLIDAAVAVSPADARALALRGAILRLQSDRTAALAAYQAAVAADANLAEAYAEIGRLEIDLGQAADALTSIERALRLSPLDPQRPLWLSFAGMALLYADRPAEAVPWLKKSAALSPRFLNPQIWLAVAYELQGHTAEASDAVRAALRLSPGLTVERLERQLAATDPQVQHQRSRILDSLRRAGLPD